MEVPTAIANTDYKVHSMAVDSIHHSRLQLQWYIQMKCVDKKFVLLFIFLNFLTLFVKPMLHTVKEPLTVSDDVRFPRRS